MKRWLLLIGLLLVSGSTFAAASFPSLFTPAPEDLSIWYLGNIFGSDLMTGLVSDEVTVPISGIRLMSVLFGIFNQIALVVGIIIIVYTILAGTLNTAHEGKPLGEKWNSVWMPVRISAGIALLVPKGGTGYCLAQSLIMWLALQGIGAADQVWNAMIDYFAQGGAIYSTQTSLAGEYMTMPNVYYTLGIEGSSEKVDEMPANFSEAKLLKSMVCVALFNNSDPTLHPGVKYRAFTDAQDSYTLYFGDYEAWASGASSGMECGGVVVTLPACDGDRCGTPNERAKIYTLANWNMAQGLQNLAKEIATNLDENADFEPFYGSVYHNAELYINYLVGYEDFLFNKAEKDKLKSSKAFEAYKRYGWILAGNYYTVLSGFKERVDYMTRSMIPPTDIKWVVLDGKSTEPKVPSDGSDANKAYLAMDQFWIDFESQTEPSEYISDYEKAAETALGNKNSIGIVNMGELFKNVAGKDEKASHNAKRDKKNEKREEAGKEPKGKQKQGKRGGGGGKKGGAKGGTSSNVTRHQVENYIRYLTGEGSGGGDLRVAKDPILRASKFGKTLTEGAFALFGLFTTINVLTAGAAVCTAQAPVYELVRSATQFFSISLIALGMFMYAQGAMLGVFIPLIPYVTFFIGVVGWLIHVVEAISAAPLVAIGLVFPETRDDIWGRAAPAYMMILALFLRPPLMLVGFAAAMIVLWCLTELLNIGFVTLTVLTFRIEDMFGFVTIMTAYTAIFTVVVTRSYELINVVPNKVLNWIGGPGMEVQSAGEAISAAKGGVTEGAGAVASGTKATGDTAASQIGSKSTQKAIGETKTGASISAGAKKSDPTNKP